MASDKVDINFAAENVSCIRGNSAEHDCLSVRSGTKRCLIAISKSLEKCSLNYLLTRNLNWLVPDFICHKPVMCITHLKQCLFLLSESGHIEVRNCDDIIKQYTFFEP